MNNCKMMLLSTVILFSSCRDREKVMVEYYQEGGVKSETTYLNGKKNGKEIVYYSNGRIKSISHFKDDTLNGNKETYLESGSIYAKVVYKKGKKNGRFFFFYGNGNIAKEGVFKDDLRSGHYYEYDRVKKGVIRLDLYILIAENQEFLYFSKEYDGAGILTRETRALKFENDNTSSREDVSQFTVNYLDTVKYDSMKMVIGTFNDRFTLLSNGYVDTVSFVQNKAVFKHRFTGARDTIRGKFIGYKTTTSISDTVVTSLRFEFFEEPVTKF